MHAMFRPKIKLDVFLPTRKAADERWGAYYFAGKKVSKNNFDDHISTI